MAQTVCVIPSAADLARLSAIVADRTRPLKHIQRARIVLLSAKRLCVLDVAQQAGVSRPAVWRWQQRYAEEGVEGLLRDKTRPPGKPPHSTDTVLGVLALTCSEPPGEVTHWTGPALAQAVGISLRSVQRIWDAHRLQPHRVRSFKRSNDPAFAEKVEDIVGLSMDPPRHAVVLSLDEKSQIQALERTRPSRPVTLGRPETQTHDYIRHGTTTLFAALDVLAGTVIGRCMQRHRHEEFLRFLNTIEAAVPAGKLIHVTLDNYATHKHPKVRAWLARHPRWIFHFTPTSASWTNAVEGFFSALTRRQGNRIQVLAGNPLLRRIRIGELNSLFHFRRPSSRESFSPSNTHMRLPWTRRRLKRGSFSGIVDLQAAINRYIAEHNDRPKPFVWTKPAAAILDAVNGNAAPSE